MDASDSALVIDMSKDIQEFEIPMEEGATFSVQNETPKVSLTSVFLLFAC